MKICDVKINAFLDQKPGTSGLRKKVKIFQQNHYAQSFIQAIFNSVGACGKSFVLGGDGRFYSDIVIQQFIKMAVAQKVSHLLIGQNGLLSTPAISHLIRKYKFSGGFILSASHNPGGEGGDFGIKYNMSNGGSATENLTEKFFQNSKKLQSYQICDMEDIPLHEKKIFFKNQTKIEIIDPVEDYANFMEEIFDFSVIQKAGEEGLTFQFDAMNSVVGIYAKEIFVNRLNFPEESVWRAKPLRDFGGNAPDPNLQNLEKLYKLQMGENAVDLAAASDGDGDRNLIIGKHQYISPSDSLAILLEYINILPFYASKNLGVARSMPTSCVVDQVAFAKKIPLYETPTGWKFFGNLLDTEKIILCGEESYGTGSSHIREKDGLWAIIFWLYILSNTRSSALKLMEKHWKTYGRVYHARYDYENLEIEKAEEFIKNLRLKITDAQNEKFDFFQITKMDDFTFEDPTDHSLSKNQGIRIFLSPKARVVFRLSGTGTSGKTLRIYTEFSENNFKKFEKSPQEVFIALIDFACKFSEMARWFPSKKPDVIV